MNTHFIIRQSANAADVKNYDTARLRSEFLVQGLLINDEVNMVYSHFDRIIAGGAVPVKNKLQLESIEPLKAAYFLERREIGIINVGGPGKISADNNIFLLGFKDALYLGKETKLVVFESADPLNPARFYFNSTPAHCKYPDKLVALANADIVEAGAAEQSNARRINKLLVNSVLKTCQLQMGMTELMPGSVWNTMPPHLHDRRMEVYFYFNIPEGQAVCHLMGELHETRHIWMHNEEAVISPEWSIHSGCGTSNYCFIWGMAGENLDFTDMDSAKATDLK